MLEQYRPVFDIRDPFIAVSISNSLIFKTGNQRSEYPVFINKVAPCRQACPIGIDIPSAFYRASKGDLDQALDIYLQENPLPGVCGRVCYHPCEVECNRVNYDESINIRSFERYLSDHACLNIRKNLPIHSKKNKIAVIGSGPAGLSAAYHLARLGYRITLFESRSELGGMLRYGIPSYRLPRSILEREINRILSLGIETHLKTKIGKDSDWEPLKPFDAIFLSFGLQTGKTLPEIEDSGNFFLTGLEFLENPQRWSLGRATQKTLIIGGGNVAIDVARTLLRLRQGKGDNITLVCPEKRDQMQALEEEITEALEEGITILNGWAPFKLHKRDGRLLSLDFFKAKVIKDETSGTLRILRSGKESRKHQADKIIIAIGQALEFSSLPLGIKIEEGKIVTDRLGRTDHPKVFAGGDSIGGRAFVADAIASGKMGAFAIACYLEEKDPEKELQDHQIGNRHAFSFHHFLNATGKNPEDLKKVVTFEQINTLFFSKSARNQMEHSDPAIRKKIFREVTRGMKPSRMEDEISRCFKCGTCIDCEYCLDFCPDISILKDDASGVYVFDEDHCKGCGICFVACPRHVIEMIREAR